MSSLTVVDVILGIFIEDPWLTRVVCPSCMVTIEGCLHSSSIQGFHVIRVEDALIIKLKDLCIDVGALANLSETMQT